MAEEYFIPRTLNCQIDRADERFSHSDLLDLPANLIILGEAGMGKTALLNELAGPRAKFVSAQRFINSPDPTQILGDSECLLIDALDETPAFADGGAVNQILSRLEASGAPRFILSCRSEDWQAATTKALISETFGAPPIEMQLTALDEQQITVFLATSLGEDRAREVFATYRERGLDEWLGNPQTLIMLAGVAGLGELPTSTAALFKRYIDLCLQDANLARRARQGETQRETALDTLGAAFAALILSGKAALARPEANYSDDDLRLSELVDLPNFAEWDAVSGNRLIKVYRGDTNRLTYAHRRIGEWLAARWLARQSHSDIARDRLFEALTEGGIVPASLRGLFGWLAQDSSLAMRVIETDPMAVIEYGDADGLSAQEGRALLEALEKLAVSDPWFSSWGNFRAKALVSGALLPQTLAAVLDPARGDRLRMLLVGQFKNEKLSPDTVERLHKFALDTEVFYALRDDAAEALIGNLSPDQIQIFVKSLRDQETHESARLAAHMILEAGIDIFDDSEVAETIMAVGGFPISGNTMVGDDRTSLRTWRYRNEVPDHRIEGILDLLAYHSTTHLPEFRSLESSDIINLGDALIARRLVMGDVEADQLLRWLKAFGGRDSYSKDDNKAIEDYLRENHDIRQAMQRMWFEGKVGEEEFWAATYKIIEVHRQLAFTDADLAEFLNTVPADFVPWQTAVRLIRHTETEGVKTRASLKRFAKNDADLKRFVRDLVDPPKRDWEIKREAKQAKHTVEKNKRWDGFRQGMAEEQAMLEQGQYGIIMQAANVYFARYSDLHGLDSAQSRLDALCGPDLIPSVLTGFEAYLNILPPFPHAKLVAKDYGDQRAWSARYILLAALAERTEKNGSIEPLTKDQLIAAQLHFANQAASGDEWKSLGEGLWEAILADREIFETYTRLLVEPSLKRRQEIIMGLHEVLHQTKEQYGDLIANLAEEWLHKFPRMHKSPEAALMDVLLHRHDHGALRPLIAKRLKMKTLTEERRRNWLAAGLICDFDRYAPSVEQAVEHDPALFWSIRERVGAQRPYDDMPDSIATHLAVWLVQNFRDLFPVAQRPNSVTSGDTNPWDATEGISRLVDRIGGDLSDTTEELLEQLAEIQDGYRDRILAVLAEYRRNRAEQGRATIEVAALAAMLSDGPPQSLRDLRTKMLYLFDKVQAQAQSSPTDSWVNFYRDDKKTPQNEERCSDRIVEMLRQHESVIQFSPEKHLGNDREGDIACEYGNLHLPVEVKGQWHDELWRAADEQLAAQQAVDHKADGYGILLVLWFGDCGKTLKGPPRGSGISKPTSPEELQLALTDVSKVARDGRIVIKVIDLTRA
ncbi:hypothetical protein GCM10023115_05760 [Pontixanthobacter gangjinensis]|uniref:Uncharacterized protein n=1 Tax=Pontixanthobacter gangjinensis TaxID=1028742 RepID=A0A6I4SJH2_9SPHN|nr:hypothetical protein [Pontixanthobacter gangjinensis]MXO55825.1 hypothetical protein [Pontixanthobacter gangjinensis]